MISFQFITQNESTYKGNYTLTIERGADIISCVGVDTIYVTRLFLNITNTLRFAEPESNFDN